MVCRHCMEALLGVFRQMQLEVLSVKLGEAVVAAAPDAIDYEQLKALLKAQGFELLEDKELQLIEQVKTAIIKLVHQGEGADTIKNSVFLSETIGVPYQQLSRVFSHHEHLTIERYIILQKIERVKELLSYEELTLSEIAYQMGYSSVQHLSNQFKSVTGMSVSAFKKMDDKGRKPINKVAP